MYYTIRTLYRCPVNLMVPVSLVILAGKDLLHKHISIHAYTLVKTIGA